MPDRLKADTVTYKKLIAGVLVTLQKQVFEYLTLLDSGKYTHDQMMEMLQFLQKKLFCKNPETKDLEDSVLAIYLKNKFNRPMRVCGMVKNVANPVAARSLLTTATEPSPCKSSKAHRSTWTIRRRKKCSRKAHTSIR